MGRLNMWFAFNVLCDFFARNNPQNGWGGIYFGMTETHDSGSDSDACTGSTDGTIVRRTTVIKCKGSGQSKEAAESGKQTRSDFPPPGAPVDWESSMVSCPGLLSISKAACWRNSIAGPCVELVTDRLRSCKRSFQHVKLSARRAFNGERNDTQRRSSSLLWIVIVEGMDIRHHSAIARHLRWSPQCATTRAKVRRDLYGSADRY